MNAAAATRPPPDAGQEDDRHEPVATLIVRAWLRDDGLLCARLIETAHGTPRTWATAEGAEAVCAALRAWLDTLAGHPPPPAGRTPP
ncbi:hypothetical protein ACH4F6_00680 [Streptomyces sp. NPDC017936]|uniref:hypothetical protein n=1 Tax=Streptomyces sp. NPDC017936 TaxID=3365016 RepID=UPI0037A3FAD3